MKKSFLFKLLVFAVIGAFVTVTSCNDYDDDISRLDNEIGSTKSELTSQLAALKTEVNSAVDTKVKVVADDLTAAKTDLAAAKAELAALKASAATKEAVDAVEAKIDAAKADILAKTVSLAAFTEFQEDQADELAALIARIVELEEKSATKAELEALEAEIAGKLLALQGQLDDLGIEINRLDQAIADLIEKHDEDVQDLIGRIGNLRAELAPRITTIETLLEIADGKSGVLDKIANDLADHLEKINANAEAIALLRSDMEAGFEAQLLLIQANEAAIEAVAEDLAVKYEELVGVDEDLQQQITDNYDELDGRVTINKNAIEALEGRVDAIEEELEEIWTEIGDLEERLNLRINSVFKLVTSRLSAITLAPNAYVEGIEAIKFTSLVYKPMADGENSAIPTEYTTSIGAPAIASYKFNPRTFKLSDADYGYVDRKAEVIKARATVAASQLVVIEGEPKEKIADGTVNFTLRRINYLTTQPTGNVENFVALEATLKDNAVAEDEEDVVVAAQQELVYDYILDAGNIRIADKATLETAGNDAHYPTTFDAAVAGDIWYDDMTYDKVYDLLTKVATCTNDDNNHEPFNIEDYGLKYKFSVASSAYNITTGSTVTNQQSYIELVNGDEGTFKAKGFNKEAIGRTPIFKVELVDGSGNVVRRAFVKVQISVKKTEDILVGKAAYDLLYDCEGEASYELDEVFIRENVYRVIENTQGQVSLSHEEFWNMYEFDKAVVTKDGYTTSMTAPIIVDGDAGTGTATKKIVWTFDKGEIGKVGNGTQLVATLTVKNQLVSSEYPANVTFRFVVNVTLPTFELDKVENEIYWENNQYQVNIAVPTSPTDVAANAIFRTSLPQAYFKYDVEFEGNDACGSYSYKVVNTFSNGVKNNPKLSGVAIDGDYITLDKSSKAVKAALNSTAGLQAEVQHVYSYGNGDEVVINTFMVNFVRPVNFNMPDNAEVVDATDDGDEVDFNWSGLLTDWRGKAILEPGEIAVTNCSGKWKEQPIVEYVYQPGYFQVTTPASLNVTYGTVSFTTSNPITMYSGSQTWTITHRYYTIIEGWQERAYDSGTLYTPSFLTQADVNNDLSVKRAGVNVPSNNISNQYSISFGEVVYNEETIGEGTNVEYQYVQSINYTPAVEEWVEGEFIAVPVEPTAKPTEGGTVDGERINEWVWVETCIDGTETVPGQYWDFYGPFGDFTADFENVTTNLDYTNGKLPVTVTLTQVGTTIKYVNVGAPIGYEYEIYVPATVTYGWGTLSTTLTIVVNPVNQ